MHISSKSIYVGELGNLPAGIHSPRIFETAADRSPQMNSSGVRTPRGQRSLFLGAFPASSAAYTMLHALLCVHATLPPVTRRTPLDFLCVRSQIRPQGPLLIFACRNLVWSVLIRDVREWLFTFPFPPIPMQSIPIPSHSHSHAVDRNIVNVLAICVEKNKSVENCNTRVMRLNLGMHRPIRDKCVQPVM